MRKKIMLIGKSESGKTTLLQSLNNQEIKYHKTQAMQFAHASIDSPGEYLENPRLYSALINASYEADIIALVQCADNPSNLFAPQFATAFNKPVIGVITKSDIFDNTDNSQERHLNAHNTQPDDSPDRLFADSRNRHLVEQQLIDAGASTIFSTSAYNNIGVTQLRQYLNWE